MPDSTVECEAYCDRRRAIDNANSVAIANYSGSQKSEVCPRRPRRPRRPVVPHLSEKGYINLFINF
jgi:hypothetical protein